MKIQYASDLHLEFPENKRFLGKKPLKPVAEILVLAGDIVPFAQLHRHNDFFDFLHNNFEAVYWIPGNHEYYGSDINHRSGSFTEQILPNIFLVNNQSVIFKDVRFLFTTSWTKIGPRFAFQINRGMNDFHVIRDGTGRFSVERYNQLHEEALAFLRDELSQPFKGTTVVVTHHVPTLFEYPLQYKGSVLNEAFAVELGELIHTARPDYWLYGHHHQSVPALTLHSTLLLNNQLGYVAQTEHGGFRKDAVFDTEES